MAVITRHAHTSSHTGFWTILNQNQILIRLAMRLAVYAEHELFATVMFAPGIENQGKIMGQRENVKDYRDSTNGQ